MFSLTLSGLGFIVTQEVQVGEMPWVHYLFTKNPLGGLFGRKSPFRAFAIRTVRDRLAEEKTPETEPTDLLYSFMAQKSKNPNIMTDNFLTVMATTNVVAGALSPSAIFRDIFRFLADNPADQDRLRREIRGLVQDLTSFPVSLASTDQMPYLQAVVHEGIRIHRSIITPLERVVSSAGLDLPSGPHLPPGTLVGAKPALSNRRTDYFGPDADDFNPRRWLRGGDETEDDFAERKRRMDHADLSFGTGSRSCLGKNIAAQGCGQSGWKV